MKRYLINFFGAHIDYPPFLIMTDKTEDEIQAKTDELLDKFFEERDLAWDYDDLVDELEKAGYFKVIPIKGQYEIRA